MCVCVCVSVCDSLNKYVEPFSIGEILENEQTGNLNKSNSTLDIECRAL